MVISILLAIFETVNSGTMIKDVKVIVFDADDTLWDNQSYFDGAERVFVEELREYGTAEELSETLFATESANMPVLGYGAKAVCISMMETALAVSHGKIPGENLSRILSAAKSLLSLPAEPLPGVRKTLKALKDSGRYRLLLLTKGDMLDQQNKLRRSGLRHFFDRAEVVSNKSAKEYLDLCQSEGIRPEDMAMVGNSFKSDIQPVIEIGGYGVHIPFHTMWRHEVVEEFGHPNIIRADSFEEIANIFLNHE